MQEDVGIRKLEFEASFHLYIYIYILCLYVCLSVTDKRQNGRIDRAQILCGTSHDPREVDHQIWKKILENSWIFLMRQFEKKSKKICK